MDAESQKEHRTKCQIKLSLGRIFRRFFPGAETQRCQKHAKARSQTAARSVFQRSRRYLHYAPTQRAARTACFTLKQQWGRLFPSAAQIIDKDLDSLLTFFQFDPTYWTVLLTTNPIERLNKELKLRTRGHGSDGR